MPLTEILAPTDISNTGEVVFQPRITALSNGDYALTYVNLDLPDQVISAVFDAQGQPVGSSAVVQFVDEESDIAGLSGGGYALAWDDLLTGGIFTAVYNAQGQQISTPVNAINSPDLNSPAFFPEVNALSNGGYALTWQVSTTLGNYDIITTIFDAQGQQVVAPINVSNTPDINDGGAAVAALSAGGYALAWTAGTLNGTEIFAAVYDNQGQQVAAPVIVAAGSDAQVAALSTGGYALFWDSGDAFTAVYDPQGQQVSAPVKVSNGGGVSAFVQMTALSNGAYALTWDAGDVFTAVYDSQGRQVSAPVNVSNSGGVAAGEQVTALSNGAYAVTWHGPASGTYDVFIAVYNVLGQQVAAPLNVSNSSGANDFFPAIAALADGAFALTWDGPGSFETDAYTAVYKFNDDVSIIGSADILIDLSALFNIGGNVIVTDNGNAVTIDLSNLFSVGGNFVLSNNGAVLTITVPSLTQVGGDVTASGNTAATTVDFSSLITAGGSVEASGNTAATTVDFGNLTSAGGSVSASGDTAATTVDFGSLTTAGGPVEASGDTAATTIAFGNLTSADGSVSASGDTAATIIDFGSLTSAGGSVSASGDTAATTVDFGSLTTADGPVEASGDTAATTIAFGSLTSAGGSVEASGDISATTIDFGNLTTAGGSVSASGNTAATTIDFGSLTTASGPVTVSGNTAVITIDLGALIQAGALVIADNGVITLNLSALVKVGGRVAITHNDHLLAVDMPDLTDVTGDVSVSGNGSATGITMHALSNVGGAVEASGNTAATTVDFGNLTSAGGSVSASGNTAAATVAFGSLATAGGPVEASGDTAATTIDFGSLISADGSVSASGDTAATTIDFGSLDSVGGDVTVDSGADATLDAGALGPSGGQVVLTGLNMTTTIILGSLDHLQGTLTITSADGVTLTGHAGLTDISITGTASDDTLIGSAAAANLIDGSAGDDALTGGNLDDTITGGSGNDALDGRGGSDTAAYSGNRGDYGVAQNGDGSFTVTDARAGSPDGVDMLRNIELLKFTDGTIAIACFCRGTLIMTDRGEVAVEDLAIGQPVMTLAGEPRPIRWIGRRAYDGRFVAGNRTVLPIRIDTGALADGVPRRGLSVSPEHAFYIEGVLVPAGLLVNGATIIQEESAEQLEYFHIELATHDILLAEGAPAESYVDCDNRLMFQNAGEFAARYPDDRRPAWDFCAPRLEPGAPELTAIRTALLDRAEHLGYALDSDPDLHLIVDGAIVPAQTVSGGVYRFDIPAGSAAVWLASRSVVPAEAEAASRDIRRLGVAVERLVLCDGDLSIEAWHAHPGLCDGFHDDEASHRWTDGLGRLPEALLRPFAAAFALELHLAPCTLEYPVSTPEHSDAAATHNTSLGGYAISPFRRELPVPVCPRKRA